MLLLPRTAASIPFLLPAVVASDQTQFFMFLLPSRYDPQLRDIYITTDTTTHIYAAEGMEKEEFWLRLFFHFIRAVWQWQEKKL